MAAVHLALIWGLLQLDPVRSALRSVAPMMVDLIAPPRPDPPAPPPPAPATPPRPQLRTTQPRPPAPLIVASPAPAPTPELFTAPAPPPEPAPASPVARVSAPAPAAVPMAAPAPRKLVPATAVQYLALPPVEVPRLSRRAGESGTVWLRVLVDVRGRPSQVSVQRSSGHARLDEQAVWAMQQARFKPYTENGQPFEIEVMAPVEYTLE